MNLRSAPQQVELVIEDDGPGVPESDLERIFEPFVRINPTNRQGHGLGLAISRRIIRAHGGEIFATRALDKGLNIIIRLPLA